MSPSFGPSNLNNNRHGYSIENRGHHHSGSAHSHSRSAQSGPSSHNKQNVNDINMNISNASTGFQAHNVGTPIYKPSGSPLVGGQNAVGTPRSDNSGPQQTQQINANVSSSDLNRMRVDPNDMYLRQFIFTPQKMEVKDEMAIFRAVKRHTTKVGNVVQRILENKCKKYDPMEEQREMRQAAKQWKNRRRARGGGRGK